MNFAKNIINILFKHGRILALLFLFLIVFGSLSLAGLKRQGFPEVLINIATVQTVYPNANAEQVESDILIPIENAIGDIDEITDYSMTAFDGMGFGVITFDQKADISAAMTTLQGKVDSVTMPENALDPVVDQIEAAGVGEFVIALSGFDSEQELFDAGLKLEDSILRIDGIKSATILNEIKPQIHIHFDDEQLDEEGLTRSDIEAKISAAHFSAPAGSFIEEGKQINVLIQNSITSVEDLKNLRIADDVVLSDVADIEISFDNQDQYNRIGYRESGEEELRIDRALLYGIEIKNDADILIVSDDIDAFASDTDEGRVTIVYSQAESTRLQIEEITQSIFGKSIDALGPFAFLGYLFGGLGFVVLLLLVFMNIRVALMAALAIPLSLFSATIYLNLVGIDLNTLVLFSMVLVIGLVVDPTIVFLESMQRFIEEGKTGKEAAVLTMRTVGLGVLLAVLTNILVFVPFGVVSGFFGEIIKYIPATVIPAMMASMLIPVLFFMPLGAAILKKSKHDRVSDDELASTWKIGQKLRDALKKLLKKGRGMAVIRVLLFLFTLALPFLVGFGLSAADKLQVVQFSTQEDSDFVIISGDIASDWTFEKAVYDIVVPLQDELKTFEEIDHFFYFEQSGNSFNILAELLPIAEREDRGMRNATELAKAMNERIDALELDAEINASVEGEGPPQSEFPVSVRIFEEDADALLAAANDIEAFLNDHESIETVNNSSSEANSGGTIVYSIDDDANLPSPFLALSAAQSALGENDLGVLNINNVAYDVLSLSSTSIESGQDLLDVEVLPEISSPFPGFAGQDAVLFEDAVLDGEIQESITIERSNGRRVATVSASVIDGVDPLDVQSDLETYLNDEKIEELGLEKSGIDFDGVADSIAESFNDLFLALAIAIFMIYVLLVGFFRSFFEPIIILFAIPLGLVGVFAAVAATTGQLGFLELLGVVAMAGIVVNVTILLIDNANQLVQSGRDPSDAIATAAGLRLRPIVLTQLTAFGSLIPLVYLSPFWKGLAAAIIFGIISSALLALIVVPILYLWSHSLPSMVSWIFAWLKNKIPKFKKAA